jgi:type III pantothenate kinase
MLASVREADPSFLFDFPVPVFRLNDQTPLPFINTYRSPGTLGADRVANAAGAISKYPGRNVLVIDTGTCIKMDLVKAEGAYAGGSISPGLNMRYQALHRYTGRLPLLEPEEQATLIGTTTAESIHSGVLNGMVAEIDGLISRYESRFPDLVCLLTGGDHSLFSGKLKSRIFAAPTLTLEGLNSILLHL